MNEKKISMKTTKICDTYGKIESIFRKKFNDYIYFNLEKKTYLKVLTLILFSNLN